MPEQPIPEQDPVVTKSYAMHYVIAMVLLMATLFWAFWDENTGQRPWKAYQREWQDRYVALLNKETPASTSSQHAVENSADYKTLKDDYDQLRQQTKPQVDKINGQLADVNGKLLAVRSVFTDRRAYVNALNYDIETEKNASGKQRYQRELDDYKKKLATVEYPDGSRKTYTFPQQKKLSTKSMRRKNALSLQTRRCTQASSGRQHEDAGLRERSHGRFEPDADRGLKEARPTTGIRTSCRLTLRDAEHCGPLRVLSHGDPRAVEDYARVDDGQRREEAG